MTIIGVICVILILLIGGYYIHVLSKLGKLNDSARNTAGELDTLLWDRNHLLDQIIQRSEENGVTVPDEHKEKIVLSLGMPPIMQMDVYTKLNRRGIAVYELLMDETELTGSEEMKKLMGRYTNLRIDIADAGKRYNQKATEFNAYLTNPVAGFIARRKNMHEKGHFNIALAEVA